jgi:hypothetical protein
MLDFTKYQMNRTQAAETCLLTEMAGGRIIDKNRNKDIKKEVYKQIALQEYKITKQNGVNTRKGFKISESKKKTFHI